jgi:type I restriction enzyme S subunit
MAEPSPEKEIEGAYVVPDGWAWCKLGVVCEINPKSTNLSDFDQSLPTTFVPMTAVDQIEGTIKTPEILPLGKARKGHTQFIENDVIFARITPCMENGKAAIAKNLENGLGFGSTEFHVIRPPDEILPEYIFYFIRQVSFRNKASAYFTSTVGQMRVPKAFMLAASFPLPPLPEQHRIVTKLETLLAQVDRSKDHLTKVPPLIKRFRQSVLAAACSGRLTEDWRREHPDVEPASELLNRIGEERVRRYDEECRKAEVEGRRKPKKPKNIETQAVETEGLPELPEGWVWTKLGDVNETILLRMYNLELLCQ